MPTAYDLQAGRRGLVSLTDRYGGEELSYYQLQPGDIVIADLDGRLPVLGGTGHQAADLQRTNNWSS